VIPKSFIQDLLNRLDIVDVIERYVPLKKAGASLEGAAKWSGNKLTEGAQASVEAVKQVGKGTAKGAKAGSEEAEKWFKGIGEGIRDLGSKL